MRLAWGSVVEVAKEGDGFQLLRVRPDSASPGADEALAVCYPALSGCCEAGDRVLLNTTAVDLSLGTGGRHFVVARANAIEGVALDAPSGGHIMKLRYSPLQVDVLAVESPESPHHARMADATDLAGMPVVCCGLHSQVPLVAAAIKSADPSLTITYCMTDSASLALPLSEIAAESVAAGLLDSTVSCGQAFGGRVEAVNLHSGLLAARHALGSDVAIVAIGPGVVGTSTPFGHGGIAQGEALNAAGVLGGVPIAVLRLSFADTRERHRVVSHHTQTALGRIALVSAVVPVPTLSPELAEQVDAALEAAGVWERHRRFSAQAGAVAAPDLRGVNVRTMGRGPADDPAFFAAAYATGEAAARVASGMRL